MSLFFGKTVTTQNGLFIFLWKETHSETKSLKSSRISKKKSYNNNGYPWKSSKILRLNPNFFIFFHFSYFFSIFSFFFHFFHFSHFFIFLIHFFHFCIFSFVSCLPIFSFFSCSLMFKSTLSDHCQEHRNCWRSVDFQESTKRVRTWCHCLAVFNQVSQDALHLSSLFVFQGQ